MSIDRRDLFLLGQSIERTATREFEEPVRVVWRLGSMSVEEAIARSFAALGGEPEHHNIIVATWYPRRADPWDAVR